MTGYLIFEMIGFSVLDYGIWSPFHLLFPDVHLLKYLQWAHFSVVNAEGTFSGATSAHCSRPPCQVLPSSQGLIHHSQPDPFCSEHHGTLLPVPTGVGWPARASTAAWEPPASLETAQSHFLLTYPPLALSAESAFSLQGSLIPVPICHCTCFLIACGPPGGGDCAFIFVSAALSMEPGQRRWAAWGATGCSEGLAPWLLRNEAAIVGGRLPQGPSCYYTLREQCRRHRSCGFSPWVGKIPCRRKRQPTPVFLPGKSHEQRRLLGYSPWIRKRVRHDLATKQTTTKIDIKIVEMHCIYVLLILVSCCLGLITHIW